MNRTTAYAIKVRTGLALDASSENLIALSDNLTNFTLNVMSMVQPRLKNPNSACYTAVAAFLINKVNNGVQLDDRGGRALMGYIYNLSQEGWDVYKECNKNTRKRSTAYCGGGRTF